ncbi:hypothetical protein ST37_10070 [Vibrio sp. qd031]|uniref:hypothetical protein n=1 Tax=Vibrio sp. qd031 TaxID=1603038 RepID=UPI000A103C9A|nr:hypothetical protein [Vibrio sp. qd031]ORT50233.1 hypothetical protein ST37_10070 [Vibrio sp. qd031]
MDLLKSRIALTAKVRILDGKNILSKQAESFELDDFELFVVRSLFNGLDDDSILAKVEARFGTSHESRVLEVVKELALAGFLR